MSKRKNRLMNICLIDNTPNDLLALRSEKEKVARQIHISKEKITLQSHSLFSPFSNKQKERKHDYGTLIGNGLAIYQGLQIGFKCFRIIHAIFGGRRKI